MPSYRLVIFASGSGTNAEQIIRHFKGYANIEVVLLLSNNPGAYALERAKRLGIPTHVFDRQALREGGVLDLLQKYKATHLVLAGFLWLVPENILRAFRGRIINIHPALLPKYGGRGMYGDRVHEAVKKSGDLETGITIHEVNESYDEGRILFQARCPVLPADTPSDIATRVHALEYAHYPEVIESWVSGRL
jgi:phosphoribosylglycinamide formyltransferase-1